MAEGRRSLQEYEAEQDEVLDELSGAVERIHLMSLDINQELQEQDAMLDDVEVRSPRGPARSVGRSVGRSRVRRATPRAPS